MCDDYGLCALFDDGEATAVGPPLTLPQDVWSAIATHLSCVKARRLALTCRGAAQGVARAVSPRHAVVMRFDEECADLMSRLRKCAVSATVSLRVTTSLAAAMTSLWLTSHIGCCATSHITMCRRATGGDFLAMDVRVTRRNADRPVMWRLVTTTRTNTDKFRTSDEWMVKRHISDVIHCHLATIDNVKLYLAYAGNHHTVLYSLIATVMPVMREALLTDCGVGNVEGVWQRIRQEYLRFCRD